MAMAQPHCGTLSRQTGNAVHLGVTDGGKVAYLVQISATCGFEIRSRVGQRTPLPTTGAGKTPMLDMLETRLEEVAPLVRDVALVVSPELGWME